jgi:hypothetical protein
MLADLPTQLSSFLHGTREFQLRMLPVLHRKGFSIVSFLLFEIEVMLVTCKPSHNTGIQEYTVSKLRDTRTSRFVYEPVVTVVRVLTMGLLCVKVLTQRSIATHSVLRQFRFSIDFE